MKFRQRNLGHRQLAQYTQETVRLRSNTRGGHKREPNDFLIHSFPQGNGKKSPLEKPLPSPSSYKHCHFCPYPPSGTLMSVLLFNLNRYIPEVCLLSRTVRHSMEVVPGST